MKKKGRPYCWGKRKSAPLGGAQGQATDIEISAKHIVKQRELINQILSKNTSKPLSQIQKDVDRDYYMTAEDAKKYGIIDKVLKPKTI